MKNSPNPEGYLPIHLAALEAAGLALAVFSLLVKGLGVYLDGARKIKDLRDSEAILIRLVRDLNVECLCFEESCTRFLEGMLSPSEVNRLMNEKMPGVTLNSSANFGNGWVIGLQKLLRSWWRSFICRSRRSDKILGCMSRFISFQISSMLTM